MEEDKKTASEMNQDAISIEIMESNKSQFVNRSVHFKSVVMRKRQRVPSMLQSALRGRFSETKSKKEETAQQGEKLKNHSWFAEAFKKKVKSIVNGFAVTAICQICQEEIAMPKDKKYKVFMCECEHKFNFCQSCLHHFVIYKVKSFEEVFCPHQGCPITLDTSSGLFKSLPVDVQKIYRKIHNFYVTSKDPDLRMCPKQDCDGIIKTSRSNVMLCEDCKRQFCSKCLMIAHSGECQTEELKFFEGNLHYRQCKECKFVIEKNQGCNHMTCRCGYQFCYVCGDIWDPKHYGQHDENGRPRQTENPGAAAAEEQLDCCCHCDCLDQFIGPVCAGIIKFPLKLIIFLFFFLTMGIIFLSRDIYAYFGIVFAAFFSGLFISPCQIISNSEGVMVWLELIFFPLTLLAGICVSFKEMFCELAPEIMGEYCELVSCGLRSIWNM